MKRKLGMVTLCIALLCALLLMGCGKNKGNNTPTLPPRAESASSQKNVSPNQSPNAAPGSSQKNTSSDQMTNEEYVAMQQYSSIVRYLNNPDLKNSFLEIYDQEGRFETSYRRQEALIYCKNPIVKVPPKSYIQ